MAVKFISGNDKVEWVRIRHRDRQTARRGRFESSPTQVKSSVGTTTSIASLDTSYNIHIRSAVKHGSHHLEQREVGS
jgi:hypothetical protein